MNWKNNEKEINITIRRYQQNQNSEDAEILLRWFYPLIQNMWQKYKGFCPQEDLRAELHFAFMNCLTHFDLNREGLFSTYCYIALRYRIIEVFFKGNKYRLLDSVDIDLEEIVSETRSELRLLDRMELYQMIENYCTPTERRILYQILDGKSRTKIAEEMEVTPQCISALYRSAIKRMKGEMPIGKKQTYRVIPIRRKRER